MTIYLTGAAKVAAACVALALIGCANRCPPGQTWQCTTAGWRTVDRLCLLIGQYGKCTMKMQTVRVAEPVNTCECVPTLLDWPE